MITFSKVEVEQLIIDLENMIVSNPDLPDEAYKIHPSKINEQGERESVTFNLNQLIELKSTL